MEEILKQLSLYDLFGYLVAGAIVVWAVMGAVAACARSGAQAAPPVLNTAVFLVAAYIAGHMIQATASYLDKQMHDDRPRHTLETVYENEPNLRAQIEGALKEAFEVKLEHGERFKAAHTYIHVRTLDSYVEIMQARSAFFRGLTLALLIAALAFAVRFACDRKWHNAALVVLLLVGSGISYSRYTVFDKNFVDHTYRTFYVDHKLSRAEVGKSPEAAKGRGKKK